MDLKSQYPTSFDEVRHFGYAACRVRVLPKPLPLSKSFTRVVAEPRMAGWDPGRQAGKHRQEEWMDEDDLLGGDLGEEQDLRRQLQRGGNFQGGGDRAGFKERRLENSQRGARGYNQGDRGHDRFGGNRAFIQGGLDQGRSQSQQGNWYRNPQGSGI